MTREEILDGLYEIKNWKCNGDAKTHEVVAEAIKALEQEPILDKIRGEILDNAFSVVNPKNTYEYINVIDLDSIDEILDKCKAESEE